MFSLININAKILLKIKKIFKNNVRSKTILGEI